MKITYSKTGDVLVNYEGAQVCANWATSNGHYSVTVREFDAWHSSIGKNEEFFETLLEIIGASCEGTDPAGDPKAMDEGTCHNDVDCFVQND